MEKKYWLILVKTEESKHVKACPGLNISHVYPKKHEKMSVARAYQVKSPGKKCLHFKSSNSAENMCLNLKFFSKNVSSATVYYGIQSENCASVKFINRVADLIHAMTSRNKASAIHEGASTEKEVTELM